MNLGTHNEPQIGGTELDADKRSMRSASSLPSQNVQSRGMTKHHIGKYNKITRLQSLLKKGLPCLGMNPKFYLQDYQRNSYFKCDSYGLVKVHGSRSGHLNKINQKIF